MSSMAISRMMTFLRFRKMPTIADGEQHGAKNQEVGERQTSFMGFWLKTWGDK